MYKTTDRRLKSAVHVVVLVGNQCLQSHSDPFPCRDVDNPCLVGYRCLCLVYGIGIDVYVARVHSCLE